MPDELSGGQNTCRCRASISRKPENRSYGWDFSGVRSLSREQLQKDIVHLQNKLQKNRCSYHKWYARALSLEMHLYYERRKSVQLDTQEEFTYPITWIVEEFIGESWANLVLRGQCSRCFAIDQSVQLEGQAAINYILPYKSTRSCAWWRGRSMLKKTVI